MMLMILEEGERSTMERTSSPFVPGKVVAVLSIEQMRALPDLGARIASSFSCATPRPSGFCLTAVVASLRACW
jgi:hypothetical protein